MSKHGSQKCMVNKGNKMELFRNTTVIKNNYFALVPGKNGIKSRGVHFEKFSQSFKVWYDIAGESVLGPHVQQYISLTQLARRHAVCYSCDLFCWCNPQEGFHISSDPVYVYELLHRNDLMSSRPVSLAAIIIIIIIISC